MSSETYSKNTVDAKKSSTLSSIVQKRSAHIMPAIIFLLLIFLVISSQSSNQFAQSLEHAEPQMKLRMAPPTMAAMDSFEQSAPMMGMMSSSRMIQDDFGGGGDAEFGSQEILSVEEADSFLGQQLIDDLDRSMDELSKKEYNIANRMLVHNGDMSVQVWQGKLNELVKNIQDLVEKDGNGYIENKNYETMTIPNRNYMYDYNHGRFEKPNRKIAAEEEDERPLRRVHMTLRVKNDDFFSVMETIRDTLVESPEMVLHMNTYSRDVTEEFVDASSRADVMEASRSAMKNLLKQATNIKDVMAIQSEINRLTERIESQRNRANQLHKQSSLSTLSISIEEKPRKRQALYYDIHSGSFSPFQAAHNAILYGSEVMANIGNTLVYVLVILLPFIFVCLACCLIGKKSPKSSEMK